MGDKEEIDWNQVGYDVRSRLGLPEEISIELKNLFINIFLLILNSFSFVLITSKFVFCLFVSYVTILAFNA